MGSVVKTVLTAFADDSHQFLAPTLDSSLPPITLAPRVLSPIMASVSIHTHRAFTHTDSDTYMLKERWPRLEEWYPKLMSGFHMRVHICVRTFHPSPLLSGLIAQPIALKTLEIINLEERLWFWFESLWSLFLSPSLYADRTSCLGES